MDDTVSRWYDSEVLESGFTPLEEGESLLVSNEFELLIFVFGIGRARHIYLNRVVNDEINLAERIDLFGVSAQSCTGSSHGCKIYDRRYTSKILQNNPSGFERNFYALLGVLFPIENCFDIVFRDCKFITISNSGFEEDSDRKWQFS